MLTSNIRFSIYLTFRVSKFHALFSRFLGARFALDFLKEKTDTLRVWREILPLPLSSHSTSHRRRQAPEKKEEESFLFYFLHPKFTLSLSFSLNQSFARCSTSAFF